MGYVTYCLVRYFINNGKCEKSTWITVNVHKTDAETYLRNTPTFVENFLSDNSDVEIIPISKEEMSDFLLSNLQVEGTY